MTETHEAILSAIPRLRRYAHALVGNAEAADDLVQACLERALSRLHLWREGSNMQAWLITILRNQFINQLRINQSRLAAAASPRAGDPDTYPVPPTQHQTLAVMDITGALNSIPNEQREVLLLVGLEGFSYKETAEILGIPIGTVMSRLARGRESMREAMRDEGKVNKSRLRRVK